MSCTLTDETCLKFLRRLKRNGISSPKQLLPATSLTTVSSRHSDPSADYLWLNSAVYKNVRKLALLNTCFAFFKYIIRILLSKEAWYIIVFIINALWFVRLCVSNTPKHRSHLFCWHQLICARIFYLFILYKNCLSEPRDWVS